MTHETSIQLDKALSVFTNFEPSVYVENPLVMIAGIAWFVVALIATWAIFSRSVRDNPLKRIALAGIALGGFARTFFVLARGEIPLDGVVTAVSIAAYALISFYEIRRATPHRSEERRGKKS